MIFNIVVKFFIKDLTNKNLKLKILEGKKEFMSFFVFLGRFKFGTTKRSFPASSDKAFENFIVKEEKYISLDTKKRIIFLSSWKAFFL